STDPSRSATSTLSLHDALPICGIVRDPDTAERLIPNDHRFGGKRPPFVNGYFEAFNDPKVSLVDLRETPIVRLTETGIETTDGRSEEHTSELQSRFDLVCRLLL